jgi:hypothetical protein
MNDTITIAGHHLSYLFTESTTVPELNKNTLNEKVDLKNPRRSKLYKIVDDFDTYCDTGCDARNTCKRDYNKLNSTIAEIYGLEIHQLCTREMLIDIYQKLTPKQIAQVSQAWKAHSSGQLV